MCEPPKAGRRRPIGDCLHCPSEKQCNPGGSIVAHSTTNRLTLSLASMVLAAVVGQEQTSAAVPCPSCPQCIDASAAAGSGSEFSQVETAAADRNGVGRSARSRQTIAADGTEPCQSHGWAALLPWHRCHSAPSALGGAKSGKTPPPSPAPQYSPSPFHPVPTRPVFSPRGFDPMFIPGYEHPVEQPATAPEVVPPGESVSNPTPSQTTRTPMALPEPPRPGNGLEVPDEPPPAPLPDAVLSSRSPGPPSGSPGFLGRMVGLPERDSPVARLPGPDLAGPTNKPPVSPGPRFAVPGHLPSVGPVGASKAGSWMFKAKPTEPLAHQSQSQPILEVERPQADRPLRR